MSNRCPPPKRFVAAQDVKEARFLQYKPVFIHRGKSRGRFAVGVRYEREVQEFLSLYVLGRAELEHRNGPWIEYRDGSGKRWCQPDALVVNSQARDCTLIEIKYQHTSNAWWQLKQLYLPVLRVAMPGYSFRLLEIVHWFDPSVAFPEVVVNVPTLDRAPSGGRIGTLIFNRRRERRILEAQHSGGSSAGETARPLWPAEGAD